MRDFVYRVCSMIKNEYNVLLSMHELCARNVYMLADVDYEKVDSRIQKIA